MYNAGSISYTVTVSANTMVSTRTCVITLTGVAPNTNTTATVTITQAGVTPSITATAPATVVAAGATATITGSSNIIFTGSSDQTYCTAPSGNNNAGSISYTVTVSANTTVSQRTCVITLTGVAPHTSTTATVTITQAGAFTLTSSASDGGFNPGSAIANEFKESLSGQCNGSNNFPKLTWSNVPNGTLSFVLIVEDSTNPWVHLNLYNIASNLTSIGKITASSASPRVASFSGIGSVGTNSWTGSGAPLNTSGWSGPCPPSGTHTYHFKLYALNVSSISAINNTMRSSFESSNSSRIIASSEITATSSP